MATTVTASDLTVTINDSLTLNGVSYGGSTSKLDTGCNQAVQRVFDVKVKSTGEAAQTWTDLFKLSTANDAGTGITGEFQYARITNLDATNFILLQLVTEASNNRIMIKLNAGESYIVNNKEMIAIDGAAPASGYEAISNLATIRAAADTAAVDVEIFLGFKS